MPPYLQGLTRSAMAQLGQKLGFSEEMTHIECVRASRETNAFVVPNAVKQNS